MPDLAISKGVRRRDRGSLRHSVLFNMFLEKDEEAPDGFARQSRQGLGQYGSVGSGPVYGLFSKPGVLGGSLFAVSGSTLYRDGSSIGAIGGSGPVSFAASATELLITRGETAYSYNGTDLVDAGVMDDDDNPYDVRAVAYLGGYFIAIRDGTNRLYWSASQDGRTWAGLDFAAAESAPDALLDVYVVNDGLWFLGQETVEFWQLTNAEAPIARAEGLLLKKGLVTTGAACEADNTLFWWGHDHRIYRGAESVPLGISDNGIEEQLQNSSLKDMFSYTYEGAVFVVVRTDTGTFVYNVGTNSWAEYGTFGRTGWRVQCAAGVGADTVFGDDVDGTLWQFEEGNWDDGSTLERRLSAGFTMSGGTVTVHRIGLLGNPGATSALSGQGADPAIEFRSSRDNGKTWGAWRQAKLGAQGKYRQRIEKRRWGLFDGAGGMFEARVTDPVPLRISRWFANEPSGGRGSNAA